MKKNNSEKYRNYEVISMIDTTLPFTMVEKIKANSKKSNELLSVLQFDWPDVELVLQKLTRYVTAGIQAEKKPVIQTIIEEALEQYAVLLIENNGKKILDPIRLGMFLKCLIDETVLALRVKVCSSNGSSWDVSQGIPFADWVMVNKPRITIHESSDFTLDDDLISRRYVYDYITNERIKKVLRRVNYEQTVVCGGDSASP
ncbi:hypothetical protein [Comamonas thiooxydans]|uniref:hypothetical protein n=1 Tax=Comamonas thiooxydans TaxID=363952 RepID=UPI00103BE722|nr:hypothetical protein [Comamonas thiooxydans]